MDKTHLRKQKCQAPKYRYRRPHRFRRIFVIAGGALIALSLASMTAMLIMTVSGP